MTVFWCFCLYFVNYRSRQAEILQERAEGCIQVDLQKKILIFILWFCRGGFQTFHLVPVPNSAQTLVMEQSLLSTVLKCCDARSVLLFHLKDCFPSPIS